MLDNAAEHAVFYVGKMSGTGSVGCIGPANQVERATPC